MPILRHLDLSDVDIIGNDYVYFTNENGNQYHTSNDVLGGYFFYDLQNLRDVKLPNNIKEIETYAFSGCTNLERVEIPKDVNKIGNYAFDECNLKTVIVNKSEPALITTYTFPNCADITLMVLNGCKDAYLSASFWKDFKEIIDSTDYINFADKEVEKICISNWQNDFYVSNWIHNEEELYEDGLINWDRNGDKVLSKKEAANVKKIANKVGQFAAFVYVSPFIETDITSFNELKYFTGLTRIEGWTFYDCKKLSSITIPQNIVSIGGGYSDLGPSISWNEASIKTWKGRDELGAFNGCSSLTSINIPESVRSIEKFAFLGCTGLQAVHISNMQSWLDIDFGDLYGNPYNWSANPLSYAHHLYLNNIEVTSIDFPDTVNTVKNYVFSGCQGLKSINLPNSITKIGAGAFRSCSNLPSISFPENLTSIGNFAFQNCSSLSTLILPKGLEELPNGVFSGCTRLTTIDIPSNITKIGGYYYYWDDLFDERSIVLKDGAFEGCSSLVSVNISEGVNSLGPNTFRGCTNLSSIAIPESVKLIEEGAFEDCSSLKSINLPNEFNTSFETTYIWGWGAEYDERYGIGNRMFYGCSNLTSITLPECVDTIGEDAFYGCDNLAFVKVKRQEPFSIDENTFPTCANIPLYVPIGSGDLYRAADYWKEFKEIIEVENIDDYVQGEIFAAPVDLDTGEKVLMTFKVTDAAKKTVQIGVGEDAAIVASTVGGLIIPENVNGYTVTNISSNAFKDCGELTSIFIPKTVRGIGYDSFRGCCNLNSMVVDEENTVFDSRNNSNCIITTRTNNLVAGCQTTVIPDGVASIGDHAFYGQVHLTTISVPSSVKSIGSGAFYDCTNLETVVLHEGLATIGSCAFQNCEKLANISIPSTVKKISEYAFLGCANLTSIYIPSSVTTLDRFAFYRCSNLTSVKVGMPEPLSIVSTTFSNRANSILCVPNGSKAAYQAANYWKEFKKIIESGDVNADGDISIIDVVSVINYILGNENTNFVKVAADMNGDGDVTIADVVSIINYILNDSSYAKPNPSFDVDEEEEEEESEKRLVTTKITQRLCKDIAEPLFVIEAYPIWFFDRVYIKTKKATIMMIALFLFFRLTLK